MLMVHTLIVEFSLRHVGTGGNEGAHRHFDIECKGGSTTKGKPNSVSAEPAQRPSGEPRLIFL
jgi:hypothetical protein